MQWMLKWIFVIVMMIGVSGCQSSSTSEDSSSGLNSESDQESKSRNEKDDDDDDEDEKDEDEESGSGNGLNGDYALLAWNDLGMHCVDGDDYSVFSILPPYNNLHAQLKAKDGDLITSGITMTYEAEASAAGILNTTSIYDGTNEPKTNFWSHVDKLFGVSLADDTGLTGSKMQSTTPQPLHYNVTYDRWEAEGIPITPIDDNGVKNYYPRVKVVAKDSSGAVIAEAVTVFPVSDEMDCRACHGSTSGYADAKPSAGWVNDTDVQKDYKRNILRLHDDEHPDAVTDNLAALSAKGYSYEAAGLEATQDAGTPILCASCHSTNALPGTGVAGVPPLTQALHSQHADVKDPDSGLALDSIDNRGACYLCHPGEATECLRGAMGTPKNVDGSAVMDCQSCHGTMAQVGSEHREGWLEQPNCQACHQDGEQHTTALTSNGTLREALDQRFATNANTPAPGLDLYRFSKGHGDMKCESCHGSTHAIFPTHEAGDNLLSQKLQGHDGTVAECTSCHSTVPMTKDGGPHGMHTVGQAWVKEHEDHAERSTAECKACHGDDFRGSVLSKTWTARSFDADDKTVDYAKGEQVGCYDCHNGPSGD